MTSQYSSRNCGEYVDIVGYRSQETRHSSSFNWVTRAGVERRGEYKSPTSHYSSPNQGERGRLLNFSVDTVSGDGRVGYSS